MKRTFPQFSNTRPSAGFSTLEILLAMTILILTISSVTMTSFGSQSMQTDAETSTEALHESQSGLEYMQTLARKDFHLVTPTSTDVTLGAVTYHRVISVSTTTAPDYATKKITSNVTWTGENNRPEHVTLSSLVTNFDNAVGGDTCDSVVSGDWTQPHIVNTAATDFLTLIGTSTGVNVITGVDAYKNKVYVTVNIASNKTDPRLFVFDVNKLKTDPTHSLLGKLATATTAPASSGMYAVHVAEGPLGHTYAYIADDYPANWSSCSPYYNCAQLSIVDVTDPTKLKLASTTYLKLPNVTGLLGSGGAGNSIFYKDGLLYLGLTKTLSGPEFNIIDVRNPLLPALIPNSGLNLDFDVSAIRVVGNIAYLAMSNDAGEVVTVDVSNPAAPVKLATYDAPGQLSAGYGRSLEMVGDRVYLGRSSMNSGSEFLALDASSSLGIIATTPLSSRDIGTAAAPFSVFNTIVRGTLAFIVGGSPTGTGIAKFYVENLANPANVTDFAPPFALPNYANTSVSYAMDCEGNDFYVGSRDAANLGYLSVITSAP